MAGIAGPNLSAGGFKMLDTTSLIPPKNQAFHEGLAHSLNGSPPTASLAGLDKHGFAKTLGVIGVGCAGLISRTGTRENFAVMFKAANDKGRLPKRAQILYWDDCLASCIKRLNQEILKYWRPAPCPSEALQALPATPGQISLLHRHNQYPPKSFSKWAATVSLNSLFFSRDFQRLTGRRLPLKISEFAVYEPTPARKVA